MIIFSLALSFKNPLSLFLWEKNILGLQAGISWRIMVLFNFAISILAGVGIDRLSLPRKKLLLTLALPLTILIIFSIYAVRLPLSNSNVALLGLLLPFGILTFSIFAFVFRSKMFLVTLLLIELFYFGWKYTTFVSKDLIFPTTPAIDFLINHKDEGRVNTNGVIPVNFNIVYGIEVPQGYDAVYPESTAKYLAVLNSGDPVASSQDRYGLIRQNLESKLIDLVNVGFTVKVNEDNNNAVFTDKSVNIIKNNNSLPRQFYVSQWEVEKDKNNIFAKLLEAKFDVKKKVIIEEDPPRGTKGFVFVSEAWYPGWEAKVDGKYVKIYRANYAFRAVSVDSPDSKIEFIYKPPSFYNGLALSLVSLFILLILYPIVSLTAKIRIR